MSNDSNVSIDGKIDAGFTSYWDSDKHGQTVGGTTEDDMGSVETDIWPKGVDPEDLTEKQKSAISTAVKNPSLSTREVAERCGVSQGTVQQSLVKNATEWYYNNFKDVGKSKKGGNSTNEGAAEESQAKILDEIKNNSGISTGELVDKLGLAKSTVCGYIKNIDNSEYEVKRGVDGYHHRAKVYYPAESGEGTDQNNQSENSSKSGRAPEKATLTTKPINGSDYYYWQWREGGELKSKYIGPVDKVDPDTLGKDGADNEGAEWAQKEDDNQPEQDHANTVETQETDVQEILGVLKKTAVHQETKQALDVLEGYL